MRKYLYLLLILLFAVNLNAQWTDDANINTIVNDMSGEQAVPHIAYDASGNFYVGFYSNESANYNIRLQYYHWDGIAQWANGGILISNNAQNSWITEWDLTTDNSGNCVFTFNDVRDGNANVYAYSISPSGTFNWGSDGIQLTSSTEDEYVPSITVLSTNDVIVAWSRPTSSQNEIVMQKITQAGVLSWGNSGIIYSGSQSYTGARVLGVNSGNYLMAFYKETGSFPSLTRSIYVQKFNSSGVEQWTSDVLASNSNGIDNFNNFKIASDNSNGIIIAWTDDWDNDMNIDGKVQRVESDGTINWPANGVEVNTTGSTSNQNVSILGVDNSSNVMVTWSKKNGAQSQTAIAGQKFDSNGNRQWTDAGIEFISMSADIAYSDGGVVYDGTNAMIIYEEYVSGSSLYTHVKALAVDGSGNLLWTPNTTLMASRSSEKVHLVISDIYNGQVIAAWEEGSDSDIYMQNIYDDGTMGDPPISDDATLSDLTVNSVTVDGFSPTTYYYSVGIPAGDPLPITGATANHPAATVNITQAVSVPGTASVLVTAEDGITTLTYTVDFHTAGTDATLADLTVNGTTIEGFDPNTFTYDFEVPNGDPIPVVGATPADTNATVLINQATSLPGVATVDVTAEDGTTMNTYTVNFLYTPNSDATLVDLLVDNVSIDGFNPDTLNYTYGVIYDNPAPIVDGIPNDPLAETDLEQAVSVPGDGIVTVTAEDGITILVYTVSFYYIDYDATLSDLTVDGITIDNFDPQTFNYNYLLEDGDSIPFVDGTTTDPDAYLTVTQADTVPGNAVLHIMAEDSVHENTYTVHFYTLNSDATLSDLTVDGETIEGFDPTTLYYEYDVAEGDAIPFVDGTPTDSLATKQLTQAEDIPGDAYVIVTAQDNVSQMTYQVHFNLITGFAEEEEINFNIYPNPSSGLIHINSDNQIDNIRIFDGKGLIVYQGDGDSPNINLHEKGMYYAVVKFSDSTSLIRKIIIF